ncbi:MAG: MFS transporter [Clostridium sp.]|nr:MFS transporter [Clostridium sp.]
MKQFEKISTLHENDKLKRNVNVDYIYRFLSSLDISAAIWMLYLGTKGISLIEIGVLEGIFHVASLICEVPTGAIADILGRKKTIVIGRLLHAVSSIIMLISFSFWQFALGFIIQAISYNLNSGSEEALVYDSLKIIGKEDNYTRINGSLNFIIEVSQGAAVLIGGILSDYSFTYSYIVAVIISLCAFSISLLFKEPEIYDKKSEKITIKGHFKQCYKVIKSNKKIILMMLYFEFIFMVGTSTHFYTQKFFSDMGYSRSVISIIYVCASIGCAIGAKYVYKIERVYKEKLIYLIPLISAGFLALYTLMKNEGTILGFILFSTSINMLYPISSSYINKLIPSKQRATLISIESMCFSLYMIIFFPILGVVGEKVSLKISFTILTIILFFLGIVGKKVTK